MNQQPLSAQEIRDGAPFAALSYVGVLWILAFVCKRENAFASFHAKQGIVIFIGWVIACFMPLLPFVGGLLKSVAMLVLLIASFYGIYLALTGKMKEMPVVGGLAKKLVV